MQHIQTNLSENSRNEENSLLLALSVAGISFLDFNQKKKLTKNLDSPYSLALQSIEEIFKLAECGGHSRAEWNGEENLRMAQAAAWQCQRLGIKILLYDDVEYPDSLRQISDPPFALFVRGDSSLLSGRCVSVVGTRRLTQAGR